MGQVQSQIDPRHIGIYKKLLAIQNYQTRLQMIDTLLGDPTIVHSARIAGIYSSLLQFAAAVRHGTQPPHLPGEAGGGGNTQKQQVLPKPVLQQRIQNSPHPVQMQIVQQTYSQDHYQRLSKPKSKDKALSFFTACLKVLAIEEEVALTESGLKNAYKKAALRAHPDKQGGSKEAFDAVTRAYAYLQDILRLVKGNSTKGESAVPELGAVQSQRSNDSESWKMPSEPVVLNAKNLNMTAFNNLFEQTRVPDPDDDGYGDWLKDEDVRKEKRLKGSKKFSEEFNREVFNQMFEEEQHAYGRNDTQLMKFQHPQELIMAPTSGVELGRERPADYTAAPNADVQYTDLRQAYTKENTITEKVSGIRVEARDFNTYQAQRERAPDMYSQSELASLAQHEAQQKSREEARRIRAAQEQVGARDYFERMKQLVITHK